MSTQGTATGGKRKRARSPNYPGIDLESAVLRADTLYREERTLAASVSTILKHWGYDSPKSGLGSVSLAALKQFGLLVDEGTGPSREARLSSLALRIVQDKRPNSAERQQALREAALMPKIHQELWNFYERSLPSDANLQFHLVNKKRFSERGAQQFIKQFKKTLAYADVTPDNLSLPEEDNPTQQGKETMPTAPTETTEFTPSTTTDLGIQSLTIPLSPEERATFSLPRRMSKAAWEHMVAVLEAMKPGIVVDELIASHSGELYPGEFKAIEGRRARPESQIQNNEPVQEDPPESDNE